MREYHKINTIFKRDQQGKLLIGQYSMPELEYLADNVWQFTEKIDGTNIRIMWDGQRVTYGGKTDNAQIPAFLVTRLQELFTADKFAIWNAPVCLYGEGYGAKIQKAGINYKPDGTDFILFDVWINGWWLKWDDVIDVANKMEIHHVPVIGEGTLSNAIDLTQTGFNSTFGGFIAEGLVIKPIVDLFCRNGERIIAKIKHKDFIR